MARPNRANYGALAETPEVVFGGVRPRNSSLGRSEFNQLSETISSNLFTIQGSGSNLERALKSLGTEKDNQGLRDSVHVIQMSANQIVNQTSQELMALATAARLSGDRMCHLQLDRLKLEFEKSLQRYSTLQKEVAGKMKSTIPYGHWEEKNTSDTQNLLEKAAEEKHQKLQELKEIEFEQQMLLEREERIRQIESDMIDVNQIMKELSAMVQEQGENINSIENNVDRTYTHVEEGRQELEKASSHQKTHRKWLCFLTGLALTVAGIVGLVIYLELRSS
ncbi:syntaxin-7-like [Daphnia carinata]|uniref:syntaxin-7-like n=1 Tax=Daphnia carinata TaxID=120202 RepID=UPI00257C9947|nr:syntaxin-7-like [Daphnia carinata]XP_057369136.1 syntaxin-7-like [Daphnia carinata]